MSRWQGKQRHVAAGQLLLLVSVGVVGMSLGFLHPSLSDWAAVTGIGALLLLALLISMRMPWTRLPDSAALAFPALVMVGLAMTSQLTRPDIGNCFAGLFVLCFAYVGGFLPHRSEVVLLPLAVPAYVATIGVWTNGTVIRLMIALAIWVLIAEVAASMMKQQRRVALSWERAALIDDLTGVGNRRSVDRRLLDVNPGDVVVMCDLDHFKALNDVAGHAFGDEVLRDFGATVRGCLRGDDYVGRYGGEEFLLVLAETRLSEVDDVLQRVRRRFRRLHPEVTFSAGYAEQVPGRRPEQTTLAADGALYLAKDRGRNCFVAAASPAISADITVLPALSA